jgi:hypothetical protein
MATAIANEPHKLSPGGYHKGGGGSSAASPVVAGIAALYLQKNPTASYLDFKNALITCAHTDSFTWGPFPNAAWGYGKADGFAALTCTTVSVVNLPDEKELKIFPNPAQDELNIVLPNGKEIASLVFFDSMGRKVLEKTNSPSVLNVSTEKLGSGIYFVRIGTKSNDVYRAKILIE